MTQLGPYGDLIAAARSLQGGRPTSRAGLLGSRDVRALIGFDRDDPPIEPRVELRWSGDGLDGEELSWSVGYGPRTHAWVLRPRGGRRLPGVLALHGHDGYKFHGKEKVADGPVGTVEGVAGLRDALYGGRAFANELARRGFVVLCHDVFLWGSRRMPAQAMPFGAAPPRERDWFAPDDPGETASIPGYNRAAGRHEHVVAKYATVLGTTLAGIVAYEDRIAAAYLRSRSDVGGGRFGVVGLSGGGCRAALLQATSEEVGAAVVVGMMSTHDALLERHVASHTWMFFPPSLAARGDWPDVAGARAPSPLYVQYLAGDHLFPPAGMEAAHRRLGEIYAHEDAYTGEFYPGGHRFDEAMQDAAFDWLAARIGACQE